MRRLTYVFCLLFTGAVFADEVADPTRGLSLLRRLQPDPNTHECVIQPLGCNTTVTDQINIFGCEANNFYGNIHRVTNVAAGTRLRFTISTTAFGPAMTLFPSDSTTPIASGTTSIDHTVASAGAYDLVITTTQPLQTGGYTLTSTCTSGQPPTGSCTPSSTTVCLSNNRFAVSVAWRTANGQTGQGQAIRYTPDSGLFWFFAADNIEMIVKILNACGLNSRFWVYGAATTDVEYTITVRDTARGTVKTYFHGLGTPAPAITDTSAFATCP